MDAEPGKQQIGGQPNCQRGHACDGYPVEGNAEYEYKKTTPPQLGRLEKGEDDQVLAQFVEDLLRGAKVLTTR